MLAYAFSLVSPNLPIGGFSYSQALEAAVEYGVVSNSKCFQNWLLQSLKHNLSHCDLPLLKRLFESADNSEDSIELFESWTEHTLALRNTKEFLEEEISKGKALIRLITALDLTDNQKILSVASKCYLAAFALYAKLNQLDMATMLESYSYLYLESQVIAAIKLVPLGQTEAWRIIHKYSEILNELIEDSYSVEDDEIGAGLINQAILSVKHENQYSRLFRS